LSERLDNLLLALFLSEINRRKGEKRREEKRREEKREKKRKPGKS
jgi:hypothetical protein